MLENLLVNLQASAYNSVKKETLAQVLSCKFCEIFKIIFLTEHLRAATSDINKIRSTFMQFRVYFFFNIQFE